MRMSCNGCRVLRKGCSDKCSIKSCLQWIKSPESQANATVFLAKFYGRAGLLNLINAGPSHLRPGIFRSLLYEACGRIVNPIYGATGLLLAGNWQLCQAAVDAVLTGSPIKQVSADSDASTVCPPLKACDIRHVSKKETETAGAKDRRRVKTRENSEEAAAVKPKSCVGSPDVDDAARVMWSWSRKAAEEEEIAVGSPSRDSGLSQHINVEQSGQGENSSGGDAESGSEGTVQVSLIKPVDDRTENGDVELELTLGLEPVLKRRRVEAVNGGSGGGCGCSDDAMFKRYLN